MASQTTTPRRDSAIQDHVQALVRLQPELQSFMSRMKDAHFATREDVAIVKAFEDHAMGLVGLHLLKAEKAA